MKRMFEKSISLSVLACAALAFVAFAAPASADWQWTADEPSTYDSTWPYSDSTPQQYGYPFEIMDASLTYNNVSGDFSFDVDTNFGDTAYRNEQINFDYSGYAAGDLYILVRDKNGAAENLYGLTFEEREGKAAGSIYEVDLDNYKPTSMTGGFLTGSQELYVDLMDGTEKPRMTEANGLPGLLDDPSLSYDLWNSYPTQLVGGNATDFEGSVAWSEDSDVAAGHWTGTFNIGEFAFDTNARTFSDVTFDIWWSMSCGNDAVRIQTIEGGVDVPTPSALLLVGIGLGTLAIRRRIKKSK